jgi:hypothetical protein
MRTSKKLLSFFLAVVMVITTCSVGFTAFAKDYDSMWKNSADKQAAFDTLNDLVSEYVPSLIIGASGDIANNVYAKYAANYKDSNNNPATVETLTDAQKQDIAENATIDGVLQALQPVLINALGGKSQSDYAQDMGSGKDAAYYDYLKKDYDGRTDPNGIDFYTLYSICQTYRNDGRLSQSTQDTLNDWFTALKTIADKEVVDENAVRLAEITDTLMTAFENANISTAESILWAYDEYYTRDNAPLCKLTSFFTAAKMAEFGLSDEDNAILQAAYDETTTYLNAYNVPVTITDFAHYAYYTLGPGKNTKYAYSYFHALETAGAEVTFSTIKEIWNSSDSSYTMDFKDLDIDNFGHQLFVIWFVNDCGTTLDDFCASEGIDTAGMSFNEKVEAAFMNALAQFYVGDVLSNCDAATVSLLQDVDTETNGFRDSLMQYMIQTVFPEFSTDIIKGFAIENSDKFSSVADIDAAVDNKMPAGYKTDDVFTEGQIKKIASVFKTVATTGNKADYKLFTDYSIDMTDSFNNTAINYSLPSKVRDTYFSDYIGLIFERDNGGALIAKAAYTNAFKNAFYDGDSNYIWMTDGNGTSADNIGAGNTYDYDEIQRYDDGTNLVKLYYGGTGVYNTAVIKNYVDDAAAYGYTMVAAEALGVKSFDVDTTTNLRIALNYKSYIDKYAASKVAKEEKQVVLTDAELDVLYGDYDFLGDLGTEVTNALLNDKVGSIIDNDIVKGVITGLFESEIDLKVAISDVWSRLVNDAVGTIFELLPLVVALLDEVVLPLVFNQHGDNAYDPENKGDLRMIKDVLIGAQDKGADFSALGIDLNVYNFRLAAGSNIGLEEVGWDLNVLLPQLLDWLLASTADQQAKNVPGISYYYNSDTTVAKKHAVGPAGNQTLEDTIYTIDNLASADFDNYTVKDAAGKEMTKKVENGTTTYTYNGKSGDLATVLAGAETTEFKAYITYSAGVPKLLGIYVADKAIGGINIDSIAGLLGDGTSAEVKNGLVEVVKELATLLREAINVFETQYANETRYKKDDPSIPVFSGLNNLFVALPRLFDLMEDLSAEKYSISKNEWTYCYDGKIAIDPNVANSTVNSNIVDFKSYAASTDANRKYDILDTFVRIFVEDWLNAIISLVNAGIATDNKITQNIPIITSLLDALGGFGENSIFTDIFNGIFQLKRGDQFSFEFTKGANGLTGLDKDNAYFLIVNIKELVTVIMSLVDAFKASDSNSTSGVSAGALLSGLAKANNTVEAPAYAAAKGSSGYTKDELASVDNLIQMLDDMLSSLLSSSSINDYKLSTTGNLASGLVSLLSNYISNDNAQDVVSLLDKYLYYLNGEDKNAPDADGNMKESEIYTNKNLSDIVIRTFALVEDIAANLLTKFDYKDTANNKTYNLLVSAINGAISPDSVGIRMSDYAGAQSDILALKSWNSAITDGKVTKTISFGISAGDKDAFFKGFAASLRLVTSILSVVLVDAKVYENALYPLLTSLCEKLNVEIDTVAQYKGDEVLLGLIRPVAGLIQNLLDAPLTTIIYVVQGLAGVLDDSTEPTIASIVSNTLTPVCDELYGVAKILEITSSKLRATSPTFAAVIRNLVDEKIAPYGKVEGHTLVNLKINDVALSGSNIIKLINSYLKGLGIVLDPIDWKKVHDAVTPADALAYVIEYAVDTIAKSDNLDALVKLIGSDNSTVVTVIDAIKAGKLDGKGLVKVLIKILDVTKNPTLFAWTFESYLTEELENFKYPAGITKSQAKEAVNDLDTVINNLFPVLESFGVSLGGSTLQEILNANLFTNSLVTKAATGIYGAITGNETVNKVFGILGVATSTADVAALLNDSSFGATYSDAAKTIGAAKTWADVGEVNWGFKDGAANAQQGFVNALVAVLRPLNNVLAVFLNADNLQIGSALYDLIMTIDVDETTSGNVTYSVKKGIVTLKVKDAENSGSKVSTIIIDLTAIDALKNLGLYGTNGYNSAIIPLLEALGCKGIVSEATYKKDIAAGKDALLLDILNPILGGENTSLLNRLAAKPVETLATMLPNIAVFIDAHGLSQLIVNLLAPVANIIYAANEAIDINAVVKALVGADLDDYLTDMLGMKKGSLTIDFSDLTTLNIEDIVIPLLNTLLLKQYDIKLADINWNALISLGEKTTYTSKATGLDGKALEGKKLKSVDYGKVLITVLRYVFDNVKANIKPIKKLLTGIDAIKNNETILGIIKNVFNQLDTHSTDQIIVALYYFFIGDNTDKYWDYTNYETKKNNFKYPDGVDEKDVARLIKFIDEIVEELDLNALLTQYLYTDNIINTIAKAMYQAIDGVKISDTISLGDILALVGVTVSTSDLADMLKDSKYGETSQFKSAAKAIAKADSWDAVDFDSISWGVKDQKTFLKALVAILRPFEGVLDVLLADGKLNLLGGIDIPGSNDYVNSIVPLLEAFRCDGIKSYEKYLADIDKAYDNILLDILKPLFTFVDKVVESPIDTIFGTLPNLALFIGNDGLVQFVANLITPISAIVNAINPIIDVDKLLQDLTGIKDISIAHIDKFLEPYLGGGNLIALLNSYLEIAGIQIEPIDWLGLASLGKTHKEASAVQTIGTRIVVDGNSSQVIIAVLRYVLTVLLDNQVVIKGLIGDSYTGTLKDILDMLFDMKADDIISVVFRLLDITQSPTEVFWCYENYKQELSKFKYPDGIYAQDADNAVAQLDKAVAGVIALLGGLDVVDATDLPDLVNGLLFTNEIVTKAATGIYGALSKGDVGKYMGIAGIPVSTTEFAKLLTDKSYGATYSSAAKTIAAAKDWSDVKNVNWGFKDGSAKAEQGFVNALVAVFRPFIDILGPFLNGENLELGSILLTVITNLDIENGDKKKGETLVIMKDGVLDVQTQKDGKYSSAVKLDFTKLESLKKLNLYGSNAYESAIIPLLDVLQVDNSEIRSFDQYVKDCKKAKDNVLLDVINPLVSFIDKVLEAPFDTLTGVLPNLAYFLDNNGVGQLLDNLLSPVTAFLKDAKKEGLDVDKIVKAIAGKDLGELLTDLIKIDGVELKLELCDLTNSLNIQDIVLPLINSLIKDYGIKLPKFTWATIASHGKEVVSTSKAENSVGKFQNKEIIADKGEVLVAVLRYVADTLIKNSSAIKKLLTGIDAIKKNDTIKTIIDIVFNTISTADKDDIVRALFYFLVGEPTNAFWNYVDYQTGEFDFSYPESVDTEFLKDLPPMLDGLIGGLVDLNGLIGEKLFTDEIVSKAAKGIYGAVEGVKINDSTNLTELLAMTKIDFSTEHVAKLLTDERYGQSYAGPASVIKNAGSWSKVSEGSLHWGVTDRDSFFHALAAVLRPMYGVLDVLLNDAYLGLFNIVRIPGSNGYTSTIVPLMEAFSMYNIKTQYQYRQDIEEEYDAILLDIINPIWDKVEDILNAPLQTVFAMLPNLALFIGNDGLPQLLDNLLTPVSALLDAIKPILDLNELLPALFDALNVDLNSLLGKVGIRNLKLDLYDINATLKPVLGGDAIIPLVNNILPLIKIKGAPLGLKLNDITWLQLASHGEKYVSASQAATYGPRVYVVGDSAETLIAVLRYLIDTVNAGDNFQKVSDLVGGLLGDNETVAEVVANVLGVLQGDTDEVIASLVDLLQTLA